MTTITLSGLPCTAGKELKAVLFRRADSARGLLKHHRAITAADELGAVNVWRGDDGKLHCERYHYLRTRASATFDSVDEVIAWLRVNLPLIGKEAA